MGDGLGFLNGGGGAARRIRERDWTGHPLGPPRTWSDPLKTALSLILNSPESMILAWGAEDLFFFYNDIYAPLLGPRVAWAMGERFDKVWADAWAQAKPIIDDAFTGKSQRFEDLPWKLDTDRGHAESWFSFSYSRVLGPEGEVAGLFVFTNETTDRILADAARRASEESLRLETKRQRLSLQQMPGFAGIVAGPEHVFEYVNDAYVAISGGRPLIGRTVREAFPELTGQGFYELLDEVYASGEAFSGRAVPIALTGEEEMRFIDLLYQPIRDDAGEVVGVFIGGYDATDGVRAIRTLAESNATLEERVASALKEREQIEDALRQAQKMEAVGQLTGGLAHDFNNLLAGISGSLELVNTRMAQGRTGDVERYVTAAQGATRRAAALTHRLLAFSRRQTLAPEPTDVNHLAFGMEELIRRSVGPAVQLEVIGAAGAWTALVDPPQLENALLNLCINARDAMPAGGRITIETANKRIDEAAGRQHDLPPGEYLSLCVSDTGTGMAPDVIARAFEPFFTTKPIGEGTGLGLSMVYGFAKQSGGQVRIYSEVGDGTTICIYLPKFGGEVRASSADMARPVAATSADVGKTVLVVDDEPTVRMLITEVLEDLGCTAIEAADSLSGLKILRSDAHIDLLVTDVGLPGGMNGRQMAEAGRTVRPGLKTLFITGYAENAVLNSGHLEPGMAVMTKPFAVEALSTRIAELLDAEPTGER